MDLTPYLKLISEKNAQSLSFQIGAPVMVSLAGQTKPVGKTTLDTKQLKEIAFDFLDEPKKKELIQNKAINFDYTSGDNFKFNISITVEAEGLAITIQPAAAASSALLDISLDELEDKPHESAAPVKGLDPKLNNIEVLGSPPADGNLDILPYLKKMIELESSDLYLTAGSPVKAKVSGRAVELDKFVLTPELSRSATLGIMNQEQREEFEATKDLDFAIAMPDGSARFRANAFGR